MSANRRCIRTILTFLALRPTCQFPTQAGQWWRCRITDAIVTLMLEIAEPLAAVVTRLASPSPSPSLAGT